MIRLVKGMRALAILWGWAIFVMAVPSARAQSYVSGLLGARQHQPGRLARHLPYDQDDYSALAALRFHERDAYWQLGLGYAWDPSGRPTAEYVLTPQIHIVFKARYLAFGLGAMKSYVADDEQGDDWSPFYYELTAGVEVPMGRLGLVVMAAHPFRNWADARKIKGDDLEYTAGLSFRF